MIEKNDDGAEDPKKVHIYREYFDMYDKFKEGFISSKDVPNITHFPVKVSFGILEFKC